MLLLTRTEQKRGYRRVIKGFEFVFAILQKIARIRAFTASRTCSSIQPWDSARLLENPSVKNFGRCTPDLDVQDDPYGVYSIPTTATEFEELQAEIKTKVTPRTRTKVQNLARGAIHKLTANQLLATDLRDTRKRRMDAEIQKRSKRLQKAKEETLALADVVEARRAAEGANTRATRSKAARS
jgi:hypothetical protein